MLELFLFVNPINRRCRQAETAVTQLQRDLPGKVTVHFVPIVTIQVIDQFMRETQLNHRNLALRNHLFNVAYQLSLDYKAAQFQGNKKARAFLMAAQGMLDHDPHHYDPAFALAQAEQVGLNLEALAADRAQEAMRQCLASDHAIAQEMGVTAAPTAVVFNVASTRTTGLRLESLASYQALRQACARLMLDPTYGHPRRKRVR
ncbi:DsbA family protein [Lacticaseibacillus parakribbianus]|uniref:DsbA family protein n=1 Tax=Lacticaseibacillus parakribbianus TaxID=2970927 RepID=UPI0021CB4409|nr:DsbA family protein [Lacticaseibacillus parakribbianus]